MRRFIIAALLAVAGALLIYIGAALLFQPVSFYAANGITLTQEPSLMSEVRAPGGVLLSSGLIIGCGAIWRAMVRPALLLAAVIYGSYGVSRLISLALDGMPSHSLVIAIAIELTLAVLALMALGGLRSRQAWSCYTRS